MQLKQFLCAPLIFVLWFVAPFAAAQVDDGLTDDFFDEPFDDTDTTDEDADKIDTDTSDTAQGDEEKGAFDTSFDDGFDGTDGDSFFEEDTDSAELPDPDRLCRTFRTDYVEILSDDSSLPSAGHHTYPYVWVRWETNGELSDVISQCCRLADDAAPRCERRAQPKKESNSAGQTALDASSLYEYLLPFNDEATTENYRHRLRVNLRANLSHNPLRRNGLWGMDMDITASMLGQSEEAMETEPFYLHMGSLAGFGAWRWLPGVRNRKAGMELIGRHHFGLNVQAGLIRQPVYYAVTFDDMPVYRFYGRPVPYLTPNAYRNYQPFSSGLLARVGMEGRTRFGGTVESNNFFTLPIQNAHVLGLDINSRVDLFAASFAARDELTPIDYPVFIRYAARPGEETNGGLVVAPKVNIGALTKVDTLRLHVGYSGEYSIQPNDITNADGRFESRYRRNTGFLSLAMHFLDLLVSFTAHKEFLTVSAASTDLASPLFRSNLLHNYLAFHLFQVLAKQNQNLDRYRHALNIYGEYLFHQSDDSAESAFQRARSDTTHAFSMGLFSALPLYPNRRILATRPRGVTIDFIGDIRAGVIQSNWDMSFILGFKMAPY
ncbi:MAG: hypothetical protein JXX29_14420 [Deltaproteobacteria bacterium]|nr:hypothetical protein [Deltaproteobacteria bacterium]MBN2672874.1 hypothetical protein [Deltaproteobacteria bacterium]